MVVAGAAKGVTDDTTVVSATIGGGVASIILDKSDSNVNAFILAIAQADIVSDPGIISIVFSAGKGGIAFGIVEIIGTTNPAAAATNFDITNNANALSAAVTIPSGGIGLAVAAAASAGAATWGGDFTEDFDVAVESSQISGASTALTGSRTASVNPFAASDTTAALVVAAWGP